MREGLAKEYGFALYRHYAEAEAAFYLGMDLTTLKRLRRNGRTDFVNLGERKIRYLGVHIADMMIKGVHWRDIQDGNSKSVTTGSPSGKAASHGAEPGLTERHAKPDAFLLAQTILKKPSKS